MDKHILLVLGFCACLVHPGLAIAADSASSGGDDTGGPEGIPLGPLKLAGAVTDNRLSATLTGGYSKSLFDLTGGEPCGPEPVDLNKGAHCNFRQVNLTASTDGLWETGANPTNHLILVVQPLFEWSKYDIAPIPQQPKLPAKCSDLKTSLSDPDCNPQTGKPSHDTNLSPADSWWMLSGYPDLQYRVGTLKQDGKNVRADQVVYGGGFRYLFPANTQNFWATWPYLGLSWDEVHNFGATNAPEPSGIRAHYLTVNGQVEFRIPGTDNLLNSSGGKWIFLSNLSTSHPTSGSGGWEFSKTFQLIVDLGGKLTPVVSYQSGSDKGFSFDSKWLVGVAYPLLSHAGSVDKEPMFGSTAGQK